MAESQTTSGQMSLLARVRRQPLYGTGASAGIARGQVNAALNAYAIKQFRKKWTDVQGCRQSKMMLTGLDPPTPKSCSEHCRLKGHLALLGIQDSPVCPRCGRGRKPPQCEAPGRLRCRIFGTERLEETNLKEVGDGYPELH